MKASNRRGSNETAKPAPPIARSGIVTCANVGPVRRIPRAIGRSHPQPGAELPLDDAETAFAADGAPFWARAGGAQPGPSSRVLHLPFQPAVRPALEPRARPGFLAAHPAFRGWVRNWVEEAGHGQEWRTSGMW